MSDVETERGEEDGRNETQERLDEEGVEDVPVDAPWEEEP